MASTSGGRWQIHTISTDGGGLQQLTVGSHNNGDPNWSPDGKSLMFGGETDGKTVISLLDTNTHRLSTVAKSEGLYSPRWSPDGRYIAAESSDRQALMLFEFKTMKWREWAKILGGYENWSHDGKCLYFSTSGPESAFYRLRINSHTPERITSLSEMGRQAQGPFGFWTGLGPDDSPLALRDIGVQEIYALDWRAP